MAIEHPTTPWAVVCQFLDGTSPPHIVPRTMQRLFTLGEFGGTSLADYFQVETLGEVDVSGSFVFGKWLSSGWSIHTYPGLIADASGDLINHAKTLVHNFEGQYRGVIAISNHPCGGRQYGGDVLWGVNGYGSTPTWADDLWRRCNKCKQLARATHSGITTPLPGFPCAGGGTHDLGARKYMTVTAKDVPSVRTLDTCSRCGVLFASDVAARSSRAPECPASGPHTRRPHVGAGLEIKVLAGWVDPPAEREWSVCTECRAITPDGELQPCPAQAGGHVKNTLSALHFPFQQIVLDELSPRGFLAHEMGHCYGFPHGRGIEPRNYAAGECWPSGYGDPFDIMSYANCRSYEPGDTDPDAGLGRAGPGLTLPQLLRSDVLALEDLEDATLGTARPQVTLTLRPLVESGVPGALGAAFGNYVVEYRRRRFLDPFRSLIGGHTHSSAPPRYRWDRDIETLPEQGGAVLIHWVSRTDRDERPNLVPSMRGNQYLGEGDFFECREGMGDTRVAVDRIDHNGATASVTFTQVGSDRHVKRWLVIPYRASDSSASYPRKNLDAVIRGMERFWTDMAGPAFWTTGTYVLTSDKDPGGNGCITVPQTIAQLAGLSGDARVSAVVDAALSTPYPLNPSETMGNDWRWCTGLILLSVDNLAQGYRGSQTLDSGVIDCTSGPSHRFPPLPFDVIEIGLASLSQARLARYVGYASGLADVTNGCSLMDRHTPWLFTCQSGMTFCEEAWGAIGPSLTTNELKARGWLLDSSVRTVKAHTGGMVSQPTAGAVTLSPVFKEGRGREGVVRLEIGPYAFEFRTPSGWDQGLATPIVLAFKDNDAKLLKKGESVSWGSPIPLLTGGGQVEVMSISPDAATLGYWEVARPVIEAGGGVLHGNGTILFGTDGRIHRIPPGDPAERRANTLIIEIEELSEAFPEIDDLSELGPRLS
jgi:hypothetical protein